MFPLLIILPKGPPSNYSLLGARLSKLSSRSKNEVPVCPLIYTIFKDSCTYLWGNAELVREHWVKWLEVDESTTLLEKFEVICLHFNFQARETQYACETSHECLHGLGPGRTKKIRQEPLKTWTGRILSLFVHFETFKIRDWVKKFYTEAKLQYY